MDVTGLKVVSQQNGDIEREILKRLGRLESRGADRYSGKWHCCADFGCHFCDESAFRNISSSVGLLGWAIFSSRSTFSHSATSRAPSVGT
jgi:hypothetical protein